MVLARDRSDLPMTRLWLVKVGMLCFVTIYDPYLTLYMDIHIWMSIYRYPYMDIHIWISQHTCCPVMKHHLFWDINMIFRSIESENNFLLNGMVKTRSHMVQNMVYIGKTYVKHCFVMKHHFRAPKSIRMVPSESENHFLSI